MRNLDEIRAAYERGEGSLRVLAERYLVPFDTIKKRCGAEKWHRPAMGGAGSGTKNGTDESSGASSSQKTAPKNGTSASASSRLVPKFGPESAGNGTTVPSIPANINSLSKLEAAQYYHRALNFAVHALVPPDRGDENERGKKPISKGWRSHVSTEVTPEYLERHFGPGSNFNLGAVVRPPYVHIDLDSKPDAGTSVRAWLAAQAHLSSVPREQTGGGAHLLFICRDLPETVAAAKKAITACITDAVQAELYTGGMNIVLSPSVHKSGHRYSWEVTGAIPEVRWADLSKWFGFEEPEGSRRGRPKKEKPWWAQFKGNLHTLDAVALFKELGLLGECLDPDEGKWELTCPWQDKHTGGGVGTSCVIFQKDDAMPGFKCLHAHCADRTIKDALLAVESSQPGLVDRHCRERRVFEKGSVNKEGLPQVVLPGLGRPDSKFAAEIGDIIGPREVWYNKGEVPVAVGEKEFSEKVVQTAFLEIEPVSACTAVEEFVETGVLQRDKESGESVFIPVSMNRETASKLIASRQFIERLPRIVRILKVPMPVLVRGDIIFPKHGYDPQMRSYLDPKAPALRPMPLGKAIELILEIHSEFCFANDRSLLHAIARLVSPFCRGIMGWDARPPFWFYNANTSRAGKDYCAGVAAILYEGRTCEDTPIGDDGEETRKRITTALMSGRRIMHFANCQGYLDDAALIGAITSKTFAARNLGSTSAKADLVLPNEIEFSISANEGLTFREDVEPRTRRIDLFLDKENKNNRSYKYPDLHGYIYSNRSEILSAVGALVRHWISAGCPEGPNPFNTYPEWGRVVGGILVHCGFGDPCLPQDSDDLETGGDRAKRAMKAIYRTIFDNHPSIWLDKDEVFRLIAASDHEDLSFFGSFGEAEVRSTKVKIAVAMRRYRGREIDGIVMQIDGRRSSRQQIRFVPSSESVPPTQLIFDSMRSRLVSLGTLEGQSGTEIRQSSPIKVPENGKVGKVGKDVYPPIVREKKFTENSKNSHELFPVGKKQADNLANLTNLTTVTMFDAVTSIGAFPEIAAAITAAGSVALDIETFGPGKKDAINPWRGDIRLLSLRVVGQTPWLIDLQSTGYDLGDLGRAIASVEVIAHNAKFDLLWLAVKTGVRPRRVFCTLTAARLLSAGTKPGNNLDQCLERFLGIAPAPDQSRSDWGGMFLTEEQLTYAARDVIHLHDLAARLDVELGGADLDAVKTLEMDLLPVVVGMEEAGIAMDKDKLLAIRDAAREVVKARTDELRSELKAPSLNPGSPDQLKAALSRAGIEVANTNEETLKAADDGRIIPAILALRGAEKAAQQADSLLDCIEADGRIHGRFEPTGTDTGRFSSKSPNLQNIGRGELRDCFRAPEGSSLIVADYSQIELRAAAAIAGETKMIEAYRRGDDLHKLTAATVLGKAIEDVTKDERQMSKACFSGDTEVLTPTGWVRFDQYDGNAPVAQYVLPDGVVWNPPLPRSNRWGHPTGKVHWNGNGAIEFVHPLACHSFSEREVMAHSDRNSDLVVTPDHEVAFITNTGNPIKRRADEVTTGNCRHLIAAGFLHRTPQVTELMTRALAMVVADGSFNDARVIRLGFSKMRKIKRCIELLMELRIEPQVSITGRVGSITIKDEEFTQQILRWLSRKKDLSWDCLQGLDALTYLDEAAYWDSHVLQQADHRRVLFSTTSMQTANVMQAMAATCGIPSTLSRQEYTNESRSDVYKLSYRIGGSALWRASWDLKPVTERQTVFCVQVPSGAILVRRNGKVTVQGNCNFGLLYGQSAKGLVRYAASSYGVTLAEDEAEEIRRAFFRTYGALRQWHGESHNTAEKGVAEVRTVLGRRRLIPKESDAWQRFTALVNTPVQGGCADGMKRALVLIASRLPDGSRLISTVHDEVIVEAPEAKAGEVCAMVRESMISSMGDLFPQVPIEVEAGVCKRWSEK